MEDSSQLDSSPLQNLLSGSTPSLIPESLVTTLTVGFIVLNVLTILFFIFYVANMIRKWRVDTAILAMQKDLADIKSHLTTPARDEPAKVEPIARPAEQSRVIASTNDSHSS